MNNKTRFTGIIPPLLTPLKTDETLCVESTRRLIDHVIGGGINGIFVNGTSGEAMRTSDAVWEDIAREALSYAGGRVSVFCGAIDASTSGALEKIRRIADMGGTIAVCTPSFYIGNSGQDEILRHFDRICNASPIEIAIYNIPDTTHVNILPKTIARLADYENVVVYKDSSADWAQFQRNLFYLRDKDLSLFNGAEELCAAAMLYGAQGCIPGLANQYPTMFVQLYRACLSGEIGESSRLQERICRLRDCLSVGPSWVTVMKYLLEICGLAGNTVSWPLPAMTDVHKQRVHDILRECGLPVPAV